ncbi:MAG: transporter associated domain-containing protein, partial [bacterium]
SAIDSGHSRMPVHTVDRDHIAGVILVKDLLQQIARGADMTVTVKESGLVRPVLFVPQGKPVSQLFSEMKRSKSHLAIVLDEYGGTGGLVTIEDLLEELVGEIVDESDLDQPDYHFTPSGELVVSGPMALYELCELIDWNPVEDGVDTVGGMIYNALGRVPEIGEGIDLGGGPVATILALDDNRITEMRLDHITYTPAALQLLERAYPVAADRLRAEQQTATEEAEAA